MHIVYIDDSYERPHQIYAGIAVPVSQWREAFEEIRRWRRWLKKEYGILVFKELHATEFVAGRGRLGRHVVSKYRRAQIYRTAFDLLEGMEYVKVFAACRTANPEWCFERLIVRIHKTMEAWDSHALLICDEGKEAEFTRLIRKMGEFNPVPVYQRDGTLQTQNLRISRIIEDPIFKPSDRSYFIQLADFVAYGLLRRERPLASKDKYGIGGCFDLLQTSMVRAASRNDPMGVIR